MVLAAHASIDRSAKGHSMRILVVGAGAVGGYFGARLVEAGRNVTFLVRGERAERIRTDGLRIVSPHGDAVLQPRLVVAPRIEGPYDLVLLGVKGFALEAAMDDFAPAVGPDTMILPVLNGMRHIDRLRATFGDRAVVGGVAIVATELRDDGSIAQLAEIQRLAYGERSGGTSDRVEALDRIMRGAGFDTVLSQNIVQEMWEKWVLLASLGAVTCLMRANVGEIARAPGGADFSSQLLDECDAIARACGYAAREDVLAQTRAALTARESTLTSSMYRDLRRGLPVEVEPILGDLVERGHNAGVDAPLLNTAFIALTVYAARLSATPHLR